MGDGEREAIFSGEVSIREYGRIYIERVGLFNLWMRPTLY